MLKHVFLGSLVIALALAMSPSRAEVIIASQQIALGPNALASHPFTVTGAADDLVEGCNFYIQIYAVGGGDPGPGAPQPVDIDLITGTIFGGNSSAVPADIDKDFEVPYWEGRSITTASGTVRADGLLAMVTFRAFGPGKWVYSLSNTDNGPTDFADFAGRMSALDGEIRVVPEPGVLALLVSGIASIALARQIACRRRRWQRASP